ncbi:NUDIX domain-containing protein [Candidatus Nomurabacteria bacterium]|nr:NUDIX domain-containing protein [Candidatus Nomurabacteria bacterium]
MLEAIAHHKVQVWVYTKNKKNQLSFLLLCTTKERGAFWQPITGSVEKNESLEEAALREAKEETGLPFNNNIPTPIGYEFTFITKKGKIFEGVFQVEISINQKNLIVLDNTEHQNYKWVSAEEALSLLKYESNKKALNTLIIKIL